MEGKMGTVHFSLGARLQMSAMVSKSLEWLQLPQMQLAQEVIEEIESNPLLEMEERKRPYLPPSLEEQAQAPSVYQRLMNQCSDVFMDPKERAQAVEVIEALDERGFFTGEATGLEEILKVIQTFDPPGIGARSLQESLLLQLKALSKEKSTAYRLIEECFESFLRGQYGQIRKVLNISSKELSSAAKLLSTLRLRPIDGFGEEKRSPTPLADLRFIKIDDQWIIEVADEEIPKFRFENRYLSLLKSGSFDEQKTVRQWASSAHWLKRTLIKRKILLKAIGEILVVKQSDYLDGSGSLRLLSTEEVASDLGVHRTTVQRALQNKFVLTPRGIIPLDSLIASIPFDEIQERLKTLIAKEEKSAPLSDEELAKALSAEGLSCARRTVAKYRKNLHIGSAAQRKIVSAKLF